MGCYRRNLGRWRSRCSPAQPGQPSALKKLMLSLFNQ
jgi:hypothetical protein